MSAKAGWAVEALLPASGLRMFSDVEPLLVVLASGTYLLHRTGANTSQRFLVLKYATHIIRPSQIHFRLR